MSYRPFRNIGRFLLVASVVSLGVGSLSAQTKPAAGTTAPGDSGPSKVDVFLGYSYFGAHGEVKPGDVAYSSVDVGEMGSGAYYFNKYAGFEINAVANQNGHNDGLYSGYAGPVFRAPLENYTLFFHGMAGGVRIGGPNSDAPATQEHEPYTWGVGLMTGGGMDYDLPWFNHMFGLRLFEADYRYIHVDYGPAATIPTSGTLGGRTNMGGVELSTGLLLHFGHVIPPPPITYACAVTAPTGTIYPGDVVTVTGTPGMLNAKKPVTYTWTSDSGPVSGTAAVATVDTKTLSAGTYTVKGHVSQGPKLGEYADCSSQFTVTAFEPPTVSCSANPSTVNTGDPATITATGMSPQNRPLTYSYSATAGTISGSTSTATLSTSGAAPGAITVTCNTVDDKGQTASSTATVTVSSPPPPPVVIPTTKDLCAISFDRDKKRPTRVDNEAKACLDDIALSAQRDPQAKLAVIGNSVPVKIIGKATPLKEKKATEEAWKASAERAVNEKAYLVTEKGVDASRIEVFTGSAGTDTASTTIIPTGATLKTAGLTPVDETAVKPIPRKPLAAPHKKKK